MQLKRHKSCLLLLRPISCWNKQNTFHLIMTMRFCRCAKSLDDMIWEHSNICKATAVTHTKRIDRNLLCKETSFVCYTSSVLRKSRHMKQKEKITHWDEESIFCAKRGEYFCQSEVPNGRCDLSSLNSVVAVFRGELQLCSIFEFFNFCNLEFWS